MSVPGGVELGIIRQDLKFGQWHDCAIVVVLPRSGDDYPFAEEVASALL